MDGLLDTMPGQLVLVVLVPHGDGGTAALLARAVFIQIQRHELSR